MPDSILHYVVLMLMGLAAGFLSTLLGIGGGVVVVPMLVFFLTMGFKEATGTSLAFMVPIALAGAIQHGLGRNVNWTVAALAIPLGLVGTYLGKRLQTELPTSSLKVVFGVVMLIAGAKLILEGRTELKAGPLAGNPQVQATSKAP